MKWVQVAIVHVENTYVCVCIYLYLYTFVKKYLPEKNLYSNADK